MKEGFMKKLADFCFILMNIEKAFLMKNKWAQVEKDKNELSI